MVIKSKIDQVKDGFRAVGGYIIGFFTMGLLSVGFGALRFLKSSGRPPALGGDQPYVLVQLISLIVAIAILWLTMRRWAKSLSGLFSYAVFGGLLAVIAGGWHSHIPAQRVSRIGCTILTIQLATCAVLTSRFKTYELTMIDRLAILTAPVGLMYAGLSEQAVTGFWMLGAIISAFGTASVIDISHRKRMARR